LEPNPTIYHTNFINTTTQAIELIREVSSKGFLLNLDIGTMLYNEESPEILKKNLHLIHHIHISEPGLACIQPHELHYQLADILRSGYDHYISIEMGRQDDIHTIQHAIHYMKGLFA
jgi:sugar phosphate isomerase/epimerase